MKKPIYPILCVSLAVISCGVQTTFIHPVPGAIAAPAPDVNKDTHINDKVSMVVICGHWNIRPAAGDLAGHLGWLRDGDVEVKIPPTVVEDMGLWYELKSGGWVNARAICKK